MLTDYKLTEADFTGNDIEGLDDDPLLTPTELKERFDSAAKDVIMPKYNDLIDELVANPTIKNITSFATGVAALGGTQNSIAWESGGDVHVRINYASSTWANSIAPTLAICTLPAGITLPSTEVSTNGTVNTTTGAISAAYKLGTNGILTVIANTANPYYTGGIEFSYPKGI